MHQWLEKKVAPAVKARPIRLRNDSLPRTFRGDHPEIYPEDFAEELKKFKPRSMWAEYKVLLAVFMIVLALLAIVFVNALRTALPHPPLRPATTAPAHLAQPKSIEQPSVYVEMLPANEESKAASK